MPFSKLIIRKSQLLFLRVLGIQTSWILLNMVNHSLVSHFQKGIGTLTPPNFKIPRVFRITKVRIKGWTNISSQRTVDLESSRAATWKDRRGMLERLKESIIVTRSYDLYHIVTRSCDLHNVVNRFSDYVLHMTDMHHHSKRERDHDANPHDASFFNINFQLDQVHCVWLIKWVLKKEKM